jgi:predicted dehydrogenase
MPTFNVKGGLVRWGILGCGAVTELKSGPGFQKAAGSALVAVMRRNRALAEDYARRHGVPRAYDDAERLLADPEVDAVYIATPPGTHAELALRAAAYGKPAYVEKPMARHVPECDGMIEAFARAKRPLFVAYYRRALPRFQAVRRLLQEGALGEIAAIDYRLTAPNHRKPAGWRIAAEDAGGGHFLDMGSHVVDLIEFLFGPLGDVSGAAERAGPVGEVEDRVTVKFRAGAVPGRGLWDFASDETADVMTVRGALGILRFSVFGDEPLAWDHGGSSENLVHPNPPHVQQPLIQSVVDELLGRGTCPSTGESARRATAVMDKVLDGYYGGRGDPFWRRPETWPGRKTARKS